jgi:hypothetical protein
VSIALFDRNARGVGSIKHDYPIENKTLTKDGEECGCLPRNPCLPIPPGTIRSLTPDPTKKLWHKYDSINRCLEQGYDRNKD